ncbi:MAG: hypothetical protein ACSLFF_00065 [Solirubrobacterales bacterium]
MSDVQMPSEVSSHLPTSVGKSKSNFRLFIFTALSVLACMAALANVAAAAAPSGEDQYIEKAPTGSGDSNDADENSFEPIDANGDGTITEAEVEEAAREKKARAKKDKADKDGATGASGAAAGSSTTPTPPAVQSVATAAKFGPFSRTTAMILALFAALIAALAIASKAGVITLFGNGDSQPPPA